MTTAPQKRAGDILILPPDLDLKNKLKGISLDAILSEDILDQAQALLTEANEDLHTDCIAASSRLQVLSPQLVRAGTNTLPVLRKMAALAFDIKSKAGQCGYTLISELAKSLQRLCENISEEKTNQKYKKIIRWHIRSIARLLAQKVKGRGGPAGEAILAEIEKIKG